MRHRDCRRGANPTTPGVETHTVTGLLRKQTFQRLRALRERGLVEGSGRQGHLSERDYQVGSH